MGSRVRVPPRSPIVSSSYMEFSGSLFPNFDTGKRLGSGIVLQYQLHVERRIASRAKSPVRIRLADQRRSSSDFSARPRRAAPPTERIIRPPILPLPSWQESSTVICSDHARMPKVQMATTYLETLNPEQRRAVEHGASGGLAASPLRVIAGAGSGKTNNLAHRVARRIVQGGDPRRILLMIFSRRAASEMTKRVQRSR